MNPKQVKVIPRCRGCKKPLTTAGDIAARYCSFCYRPHNSPSCLAGFTSCRIGRSPLLYPGETK